MTTIDNKIRTATAANLDEIAQLESLCFPESEAASRESFAARLAKFPNHFYLLETDGRIISMVNGLVTNEHDLTDAMYSNANMHDENGKWQMIFGVATHPDYRKMGYAGILLNYAIEQARLENRSGLMLTCKEHLCRYYRKFGFVSEGISQSEHGGAIWYQMRKIL